MESKLVEWLEINMRIKEWEKAIGCLESDDQRRKERGRKKWGVIVLEGEARLKKPYVEQGARGG